MAIIVMHDAMGVRLETGKQAKVLNEMMALWEALGQSKLKITALWYKNQKKFFLCNLLLISNVFKAKEVTNIWISRMT